MNSRLYHTEAANPGGPGFLIGIKDLSTPQRLAGKYEFAKGLFRGNFDGTTIHPEHWHLSEDKRAFIIIPAWMGTVNNHQIWLAWEFNIETQEAELEPGEILALNQIVLTAREFFHQEYGWNLPQWQQAMHIGIGFLCL